MTGGTTRIETGLCMIPESILEHNVVIFQAVTLPELVHTPGHFSA